MAIMRWNPTNSPSTLSRWMDDFFNDRYDRLMNYEEGVSLPAVNVIEEEDHFKLQLAAPGMKKEHFEVKVENGFLNIRGESRREEEADEERFTRREFSYRSFTRQFTLPENVNERDIKAKYEDGILHIEIPKKEVELKKSPKQIAIS